MRALAPPRASLSPTTLAAATTRRTTRESFPDWAAQHSARPQAMLMQAAGLQVIAPAVATGVQALLQAAKDSERPTFWIDHSLLFEEKWPADGPRNLPLGKAAIVRSGKNVTLVGYSIDLVRCVHAAKELAAAGIDAEVIDLRTLAPLDKETIMQSVGKTGRLVVAEQPRLPPLGGTRRSPKVRNSRLVVALINLGILRCGTRQRSWRSSN